MKKVGQKVIYEGKVATITSHIIPKCKCKGGRYYKLQFEGTDNIAKVPMTTTLEDYNPIGMISTNISSHKL
jgi:hypothetical protein